MDNIMKKKKKLWPSLLHTKVCIFVSRLLAVSEIKENTTGMVKNPFFIVLHATQEGQIKGTAKRRKDMHTVVAVWTSSRVSQVFLSSRAHTLLQTDQCFMLTVGVTNSLIAADDVISKGLLLPRVCVCCLAWMIQMGKTVRRFQHLTT